MTGVLVAGEGHREGHVKMEARLGQYGYKQECQRVQRELPEARKRQGGGF